MRLRALAWRLTRMHLVSISLSYRIALALLIQDRQVIAINIGDHGALYSTPSLPLRTLRDPR